MPRYDMMTSPNFIYFFWVENDISFCKNENYKFTISTLSRLRLLDYLYFISDRAIGTLIFFPFIVIVFMTLNWLDFPILWCHVIIKPHAAVRPYWTVLSLFYYIYDVTSLNCIWIRNIPSALCIFHIFLRKKVSLF